MYVWNRNYHALYLDIATNSTKMSIDIIIIDIIYYLSGFVISVWRCYRMITSYYEVKCRSIRIRKQNYLCKLYSDSHTMILKF